MATTTQYVFANFFESELTVALTASATTMIISPADASLLPIITAGSGAQAQLIIWDGQLPPEIVSAVTNDQSGTMTIVRAQESTTAQAWANGTQVRAGITAAIINEALAAYFDINNVLNSHFLPLTGGTLSGPLTLTVDTLATDPNLQVPTKHYVDTVQRSGLPLSGGTMQGPINMAGSKILNLADPTSPQDAATKNYIDTADALLAPITNANLLGTPTAPTPASNISTTQIATTAYVTTAVGGVGGSWTAGDVKLTFKKVADAGWLMMDDLTIGKNASTADHKSPTTAEEYQNLYILLYNNIPDQWCPVFATKGGTGNVRTGNAANDYASGFVLTLPRQLGRALAIAGTGVGLSPRVLGSYFGEENHVLQANESVPHRHAVAIMVPEADLSDIVGIPTTSGTVNGLAQGNPTTTYVSRAITWKADSWGGTGGPRAFDTQSIAGGQATPDRTTNALAVNQNGQIDTVWYGSANSSFVSGLAAGHNNIGPESFLNIMIKY